MKYLRRNYWFIPILAIMFWQASGCSKIMSEVIYVDKDAGNNEDLAAHVPPDRQVDFVFPELDITSG